MLLVAFQGGLGNQIFQYCFYEKIQRMFTNETVKADLSQYKVMDYHQGFELNKIFMNVNLNYATSKELKKILNELPRIYSGPGKSQIDQLRIKINNCFFPLNKEIVLDEQKYFELYFSGKLNKYIEKKENCYLKGFWENINYYKEDIENRKKKLKFISFTEDKNKELERKIREQNSVSVHIRRGDFMNSSFEVLNQDYYRQAIGYILEKVQEPVYYFFSDDLRFAKEVYGDLENIHFVDWNKGSSSFRDMQLMTLCRYNIIANSTFSQWGALLNQNPENLVVYPSKKRKDKDMEYVELDNWHRIEVI